jgi:hypothetical protein
MVATSYSTIEQVLPEKPANRAPQRQYVAGLLHNIAGRLSLVAGSRRAGATPSGIRM